MQTCYCLTFNVLPALSSHLSVFSNFVWTPFFTFSCCYVSHAVLSGTYPSVVVS